MQVEPNKQILTCPYCSSTELIVESDEGTLKRLDNERKNMDAQNDYKIKLISYKYNKNIQN